MIGKPNYLQSIW